MKNNNERNVLHERGGDVHEYSCYYIKIRQENMSFLCPLQKNRQNTFSIILAYENEVNKKG